jgi:decaprenylphospho-beta-D-ribofuranose 2-oxidase
LSDTDELVSGWGRTAPTAGHVVRPGTREDVVAALAGAGARGVVARGLGRSYGDPAQNAGGIVLDLTGLDRVLSLDLEAGTVRAEAGVSLDSLLRVLLPCGWFVPVTPGTRLVTLGGAVAADVHGKNHHRDGSFGRHVTELELLLADGSCRTVTPASDADLFWGTFGGMGLTGVVLAATLRLLPAPTAFMSVDTERAANLDELLEVLVRAEERHRYSVAWIDCLATGRRAGRGVVTSGEHATPDQLTGRAAGRPRRYQPDVRVSAPGWVPPGLLNRASIAAFNEAWYRKAPRSQLGAVHPVAPFFHPLDAVQGWNRMYGRQGFLQYQCVVPDEATLRVVLGRLSTARVPSFLAVLKRFGAGNPGPLSFPRPGWTLALDVPAATPDLGAVLDGLDELVAAAGGSIYLAKDSRLRPELLPALYPRLPAWQALRDRVDPDRRFVSDQSRRLAL